MRPFQGIHRSDRGQISKTMPDRDDHNREIRTRKQRTDVGKYSFVNSTIKSWDQLTAALLASFPCKLNLFRKMVNNVVTSKEIKSGGRV